MCRYFVLSIVDGKIDVEKIGELDATYEDFLTDIKKMDGDKKDCRFAGKECSDKTECIHIFLQCTITSTLSCPRAQVSHK